jgi:predicted aspartyl protease
VSQSESFSEIQQTFVHAYGVFFGVDDKQERHGLNDPINKTVINPQRMTTNSILMSKRSGWLLLFIFNATGKFCASYIPIARQDCGRQKICSRMSAGSSDVQKDTILEAAIQAMKVKEIKEELTQLNISSNDVFEKEQLVQRLLKARQQGKRLQDFSTKSTSEQNRGRDVIVAPLYFTNMDSNVKVAAVNMDGGIQVNPSDQPYATVEFEVSAESGASTFPLRLLLDTACSGFVLRPSVVAKNDLPKMSTPVTMTGAGGTVGATGLTQLSKFSIGGESFGPLPAAVQDIGALPSALDGIVGLSFLHNFAAVDMDFSNGKLRLYKRASQVPEISPDQGTLVARGRMDLIPQYGIYTVETMLGSRGPVNLLVDSGAASTFLSWQGVSQLGLSRNDSSFLQRLSNPMGAMGSDNVAMQLTHRLGVSSTMKLGNPKTSNLPGLSLSGAKRLEIDIGDIAILESMKSQPVGGILGIDALMRATCVRLVFVGSNREILMYQ